jgi:hypothetical protein
MAEQVQVDLIVKAMSQGFDKVRGSFTELKSQFDLAVGALKTVGQAFQGSVRLRQRGAES